MMKPAWDRLFSASIRNFLEFGVVLLLAAPFFWLACRNYVPLDFWFDEIVSLKKYILVPLGTTVTDYTYPNNHVFFSLLMNVALKILGLRRLSDALDHPAVVHSLTLGISTATLIAIYVAGRKWFGWFMGMCAVVILATTVPFYNFAVQVRGYGLSMAFLCVLLFLVWGTQERPTAGRAIGTTIVAALMLYTIPSNLYVLLAVGVCQGAFVIAHVFAQRPVTGKPDRAGWVHGAIIASLVTGIVLSLLAYAPVIDRVLHNPFVRSSPDFRPWILLQLLPQVMGDFVSGRWVLLASVPAGMAVLITQVRRDGDRDLLEKYLMLLGMLVLPFVFSFIRRDWPYDRVFVNLAPVLALFLALNIHLCLGLLAGNRKMLIVCAALGIWVYASWQFHDAVQRKDRSLVQKISGSAVERVRTHISGSYYQARYRPNEIGRMAKDFLAHQRGPVPVIIAENTTKQAFPRQFLEKYDIAFTEANEIHPDDFAGRDRALYITTYPSVFEATALKRLPGARCRRLNGEPWFINLYCCTVAGRE